MTDTVVYIIPARTPERTCKHCAAAIYLVQIKDGRKSLAVSCLQVAKVQTWPPSEKTDGAGVSHGLECATRQR